MVMYRRRTGGPDQDLDVESRIPEDDLGKVAEPRLHLKRVEPAALRGGSQHVLDVDPFEDPFGTHEIAGNRRKLALVVS